MQLSQTPHHLRGTLGLTFHGLCSRLSDHHLSDSKGFLTKTPANNRPNGLPQSLCGVHGCHGALLPSSCLFALLSPNITEFRKEVTGAGGPLFFSCQDCWITGNVPNGKTSLVSHPSFLPSSSSGHL